MSQVARHIVTYVCDRCGERAVALDYEFGSSSSMMVPSPPDGWVTRVESYAVEHFCSRKCEADAQVIRGARPVVQPA